MQIDTYQVRVYIIFSVCLYTLVLVPLLLLPLLSDMIMIACCMIMVTQRQGTWDGG